MEQTIVILIVIVVLLMIIAILASVVVCIVPNQPRGEDKGSLWALDNPYEVLHFDLTLKLYPYGIWMYGNLYPYTPLVWTWECIIDKFIILAEIANPLLKPQHINWLMRMLGVKPDPMKKVPLYSMSRQLEEKLFESFIDKPSEVFIKQYNDSMEEMYLLIKALRDKNNYAGNVIEQQQSINWVKPHLDEFAVALIKLRPPVKYESVATQNPLLGRYIALKSLPIGVTMRIP